MQARSPVWSQRNRLQRSIDRTAIVGMSHADYLGSNEWQALRSRALARDGNRCRTCDSSVDLDVHHRRYPPLARWDLDGVAALTTLCRACHLCITNELRRRLFAAAALPDLPDYLRLTPGAILHGAPHGPVSIPALPDYRRVTPAHAQRQVSGPVARDIEEHVGDLKQAQEDGG